MNSNIKPPCGMKDFNSKEVHLRAHIINIIQKCYEAHCGNIIDTPTLELQSTIHQLYGEEFNKSVYNIANTDNEEEEKLMMRYDLTVPFIRYVAEHGLKSFKRIQFGTVYRKDTPQMTLGRFRSFTQGDFDIIGDDQNTCIYDMEILDLLQDVMHKLLGDNFTIYLNHKQIIINLLEKCGVEPDKYNLVTSAIDKLDKKCWDNIKLELLNKEIAEKIVDDIGTFLTDIQKNKRSSLPEALHYLCSLGLLDDNTNTNLLKIVNQLIALGIDKYFVFDPSIVRGMDYYTGIIYEVKYNNSKVINFTIAGGGRYDTIIGKLGNVDVPAIGISIGIDRIMTIYEKENKLQNNGNKIKYYVARIESPNDNGVFSYAFGLCSQIRRLGHTCEMSHLPTPKIGHQFKFALTNEIPYIIIVGDNEVINKTVQIKIPGKDKKSGKQISMEKDLFIQAVKDNLIIQ